MISDAVREAKVSLGKYLQNLREECKVEKDIVAQRCGVSCQTIDLLEKGRGKYTATMVKRFIKALAVDLSAVLQAIEPYFTIIFPGESSRQKHGPAFRPVLT